MTQKLLVTFEVELITVISYAIDVFTEQSILVSQWKILNYLNTGSRAMKFRRHPGS